MLIKVKINDDISEWQPCNRNTILALKKHPPDAIIVDIEKFYENCPGNNRVAELPFQVFYTLAYEFLADRQRQEAWDRRHRDDREMELLEDIGHMDLIGGNVVDDFDLMELQNQMSKAMSSLSEVYQKRVSLYYYYGFSQEEIAQIEGVQQESIWESLSYARKKIVKFLLDEKNSL